MQLVSAMLIFDWSVSVEQSRKASKYKKNEKQDKGKFFVKQEEQDSQTTERAGDQQKMLGSLSSESPPFNPKSSIPTEWLKIRAEVR